MHMHGFRPERTFRLQHVKPVYAAASYFFGFFVAFWIDDFWS